MRRAERHRQMAVSHRDVALYMLDSALPPDDPVSATRGFCVSHKRPMLNHRTAGCSLSVSSAPIAPERCRMETRSKRRPPGAPCHHLPVPADSRACFHREQALDIAFLLWLDIIAF